MSSGPLTVTDAMLASRRSMTSTPVTTRAMSSSRPARPHPRCLRRVGAEVARAAGTPTPIRGGGDKRRLAMQRLVAASAAPAGVSTTHATIPSQFDEHRPVAAPYQAPQPQAPPVSTRTPFMAGNWKMNPTTLEECESLSALLRTTAENLKRDKPDLDVEVAVFPPALFVPIVQELVHGTQVKVGVQDVHYEAKGAFTGSVSAGQAAALGVEYVLCGHSERRSLFGDTDDAVRAKVRAILDHGMKPILCIGETKQEYEGGLVQVVCATQLAEALRGVTPEQVASSVTIAYEPVWAIGTGLTATPAIAQSVHAYIRSWLRDAYGERVASAVRIQYGGSVTPDSVAAIMEAPDVDGCLVGGASLLADKFSRIWNYTDQDAAAPATKLWASETLPCRNVLGESPVWSSREQKLYWVSSSGMELWEWDLRGPARTWRFDEVVGCVALQASGELLLGLERGLCSFDVASGAITLITPFEEGRDTRPNDGRVDRDGNFVIGSYNNQHRANGQDIGGLYRLEAGTTQLSEILDYTFRCSNCICFSPDGRTMFFCDTPTRRIYTFRYDRTGALSDRRLLWEMPSALEGGPDGAQCDAQGYLWAALSGAGQVVRISPEGKVDTVVELPVKSPTSCTIGGPGLSTLFITTRGPDGGGLFSVELPAGMRGMEEPVFNDIPPPPGHYADHYAAAGAARFCSMCGASFSFGGAKFCSHCGCKRV